MALLTIVFPPPQPEEVAILAPAALPVVMPATPLPTVTLPPGGSPRNSVGSRRQEHPATQSSTLMAARKAQAGGQQGDL